MATSTLPSAAAAAPSSPPSLPVSLHQRISDFQRSLHTNILALVHATSSTSRASSSSPSHYDLQQWLRQQVVQCLDAEKVYLQASTPSLPPSFRPASPPPPAPPPRLSSATIPDPRQLSHALHELSLSATATPTPAPPLPTSQPQPPLPFRRPQQRSTPARLTERHPHPHHHHVGHSHAVEVSVRCLPATTLEENEERGQREEEDEDRDESPLPPLPSLVTFTALAPPQGGLSFERSQRAEVTMATSACPPGCPAPSLSPYLSPCGLDFGCVDPSPFSLSCDGEDDPLCCFNDSGVDGGRDGDGMMGEDGHLARLCPSPLSSLCLPMPCDPCNSMTQTLTTTTTTTVLSSCRQGMYHEHVDDESNPSSPTHSDARGLQSGINGKAALTPTSHKGGEEEKTAPSSDAARAASSSSFFPSASSASGTSTSVMVSCHQCKLKKPQEQCLQCSCNDQPSQGGSRKDASGRKRCVKKYCSTWDVDSHTPHHTTLSTPPHPTRLPLTPLARCAVRSAAYPSTTARW